MKKYLLALIFLLFISCGSVSGGGSEDTQTLVMGYVKDLNGNVLSGVTVTMLASTSQSISKDNESSAKTTTTDSTGYFSITGLTENNRVVFTFTKAGYVNTTKITRTILQEGSFIRVTMTPYDTIGTIAATAGGTVTDSKGSSIKINANSLIDSSNRAFTGNATVHLTSADLSKESGLNSFPGEFIGILSDAGIWPLQTFGYADVFVTDGSGNSLNLATGNTATLTIPISTALLSTAANTIPLWHFDETTGKWEQNGMGTKSGNNYTATVSHLSAWNFDLNYPPAFVAGRVTDCTTNNPVKGASVHVLGTGWKSFESGTGSNGRFPNSSQYYSTSWQGIPVNTNSTFTIWAEKNGKKSNISTYTSGSSSALRDVGDICIYTMNGNYTGTYSGKDTGTFNSTIGENGLITGNGYSNGSRQNFTITGHVGEDGAISMGTTSLNNATFNGHVTPGTPTTVSGTWFDSTGSTGTFTGTKQ